ncbi:MAG: ligand-binding sensor domain-containing protein [Ignavibacteriaceae bacterium]
MNRKIIPSTPVGRQVKYLKSHLNFNLRLYLLFCLIFFAPVNFFPQVRDLNFDFISTDKGLSQNTIHCILQDRQGFMWFGTEDGLDRYDGYNFTVFKNDPRDPNSIPDNFIWTIYEDHEGTIWVGTNNGGLCKFNRDKQNFTIYKNDPNNSSSLSNNNIRTIYEDRSGVIWVGTNNEGLCKFNRDKQNFTIYKNDTNNSSSLSNNNVRTIIQDSQGYLWIGTEGGGLNKLDIKTGKFFHYNHTDGDPYSISNDDIISLCLGNNGVILVGTLTGLNKYNAGKNNFTKIVENKAVLSNHSNSMINSITEDRSGKIWVGTGGGIFQLDHSEERFVNIDQPSLNFNNNNILSLLEDRTGIIWIGTAERGIAKYDLERMRFMQFKHDPSNPNSLSYNTIRSFYQDNSGVFWIGTLGGGLNKYDEVTKKFTHYFHQPGDKFSLSDNSVSSIFRDNRGVLWVGTWRGGLNKMIGSGKSSAVKFIHYFHNNNPNSLSSNIIQSIFEDRSGRLWIGTEVGLDLYDKKNNKFITFVNDPNNPNSLSNNQVQSCIYQDRNGFLWVGTWGGLNRITEPQNPNDYSPRQLAGYKFTLYQNLYNDSFSLSDNRVISICEDKQGNLWIGTYGGGLNKLPVDQQNLPAGKAKFIRYSTKDGLPSNIIYGILEDDNGNLWLSTDNGLSKFDPAKQIFRNYNESDGLQSNQFFWGAALKSKNGELFFGGINGFNAFYPSSLKDNPYIPPVVITDFNIFNKPVPIEQNGSPLKKYIAETDKITLSYSQNVFSFEFAALDYTSPNKNQYAYMMEGFDKGWVNSGNRHFVTYTNLDPGEYTFYVRGSNNDGVWNTSGASIKIIILPPFWRTWWFILSSFLAGSMVIIFLISYRVRHLLNIERFRTKLAADLHDNIGSSLTEISIISEVISRKLDLSNRLESSKAASDVLKSLNMISDKSRNLIDSMSDIVWLVNPKRDSLYDLILRLRDTYTELSSYKSISFKSENLKSLEKVSLSMEHRQHLYLIFKEGINNCITHSGCSEISLNAYLRGKRLEMILRDNGNGFDLEELPTGNGLSNIKDRAKKIGGVLNIYSKNGEGTTLQFIGNIS